MKLKGSCHCRAVQFECESHTPYPYMRCYCSICRKTAGGGGYAINLMAEAKSLKVKGRRFLSVYHAIMNPKKKATSAISRGQRHFCKKCASCLWLFDPDWPQLIHPFASAIDTPLPKTPKSVSIMLDYAVDWADVPKADRNHQHCRRYPKLSIEAWHKKNKLWVK